MTPTFRLALALSLGVHAAVLIGVPSMTQPPQFDVERGESSIELYMVAPPQAMVQAQAPVQAAPPPPAAPAPEVSQAPPQPPAGHTVISEEHRGARSKTAPGYLRNPAPAYPERARERGHEGTVHLELEVLPTGRCGAVNVLVSSGHQLLDDAAVRAVRGWMFRPARRWQTPVAFWVEVPITFRLEDTDRLP